MDITQQDQLEARNREIVRGAFEAWAAGGTQFFDLLAPDATWTIAGSGPSAGTYHGRQAYLDAAVTPLFARLAAPTVPHVKNLWADGDHVIVRWEQHTPARDGAPYRNSYAWFFKMRDGQAVAVTAFLDLPAYDALLARVEPTPQ